MGLLAEIQNDALSDTVPVATLLRKVMVLASNMDSDLLEDWVRHELNGYPTDADIPKYRTMGIAFKASGATIAAQYNNMPIAQMVVERAAKNKEISTFKCRQAIGTILLDQIADSPTLRLNFDNYVALIEREMNEGVSLFAFWGEISAPLVVGIVDAVRSRVLDFVLQLKKTYPDAGEIDGLTTKAAEVEKAVSTIYYQTIHGNVGVAGNAESSMINITVNHGNTQELRQVLAKHGVDEADFIELQAALTDEPQIQANKKFGPKVTKWLGSMVGKAAAGTWAVSLGAAGALLEKALLGYYGYN